MRGEVEVHNYAVPERGGSFGRRRRLEVVPLATASNLKLLSLLYFLFSMSYVKGQKYDIQFTFNRLPVQMEHRACEQITAVTRREMRHVLFPQEQSLDQRGEINKTVRQVMLKA